MANFEKKKSYHISNHIQEWRCQKSLIKVKVPPAFFLEWFLKYVVPCVSKDVMTSMVFYEEEAIMKSQQLDFIYHQSNMLYEILPNAS
jgi:hypothetical protein